MWRKHKVKENEWEKEMKTRNGEDEEMREVE